MAPVVLRLRPMLPGAIDTVPRQPHEGSPEGMTWSAGCPGTGTVTPHGGRLTKRPPTRKLTP